MGIPWTCYRGHLGPSGPKLERKSETEFLGPLGPGAQKSKTESAVIQLCWLFIDSIFDFLGPGAECARELSSKTKRPGEEGAPRNHPEISSQEVADFECRFPYDLDIFENPYGAPRPTESKNPPATKKEIPKNPKTPIIPKSKRSFPKSKRPFPKSKRSFPKSKR